VGSCVVHLHIAYCNWSSLAGVVWRIGCGKVAAHVDHFAFVFGLGLSKDLGGLEYIAGG